MDRPPRRGRWPAGLCALAGLGLVSSLIGCSPQLDGEASEAASQAVRSADEAQADPAATAPAREVEFYVEVVEDGARVVDAQVAVWDALAADAPHEGAVPASDDLDEARAHGRSDLYGVFVARGRVGESYVVGARRTPYEVWNRRTLTLDVAEQAVRIELPRGAILFRTLAPDGTPTRAAATLVEIPAGGLPWWRLDERAQEIRNAVARMGSDDEGRCTMQRVPAGRYWISLWSERDGDWPRIGRSGVIEVGDGTVDAGDLRMEPCGRLDLTVGGLGPWLERDFVTYLELLPERARIASPRLRQERGGDGADSALRERALLLPAGDYHLVLMDERREVLWRSARFEVPAGGRGTFRCDLPEAALVSREGD